MLAYVVRRIFAVFPVMAVVVLFVFVLLRISPGDPAAIIAGDWIPGWPAGREEEDPWCRAIEWPS